MLPADGVGENITGDDEDADAHNVSSESLTCEVENHTKPLMDAKQVNQSRYYGISNQICSHAWRDMFYSYLS